jgi:hypothetical protein
MLLLVFSRLFLRMLPVIAALCAVVPTIAGRPLDGDESWEQFGFAYCALPCFAGITPGETPYHQASRLLRQHIPVMENRMFNTGTSINFWALTNRAELSGTALYELGMVGELRLNVPLPLDHLLTQLGAPDCILLTPPDNPRRAPVIFWIRENISIGAVLRTDLNLLTLSGRAPALWLRSGDPNECEVRGAVPWRGFAPAWNYAQSASASSDAAETVLTSDSCC